MPVRIGFLLARLFPMYVLAIATDMLRLANKYAGEKRFEWVLISEDSLPVEASNSIRIDVDVGVRMASALDYAFVLAGDDQGQAYTASVRRWLTRVARDGTVVGAIDSGAFLLAQCGLLRDRVITLHPGAAQAFAEQFPDIVVATERFVRDGPVMTSPGGLAVTGMIGDLIGAHCNPAVARQVDEDMVIDRPVVPQRDADPARESGLIERLIGLMEASIENPVSLDALARRAGLSRRHVTRLCQDRLGQSPMRYYRTIRLNRAKQLLFQSDLSLSTIAIATGFEALSSFSRSFAAEFGCPPSVLLKRLRTDGNGAVVPQANKNRRLRSSANCSPK